MFRNSMQWLGVAFLSVAALVVASGAATAQPYVYSLTDLTYGITSDCHPTGFNNSGWAVGNYYGNPDGFFSSVATGFVDLSGLSAANGINNSGVIAGTTPDGYAATCVVANGAGTVTTLGPGSANDINDFNQVVGTGPTLSNGDSHAYLYSGGVATDLGVLYGTTSDWASSWATAINNNGVIVGASMAGANYNGTLWNSHAFVYSSGTMTDLGVLPTSPADSSSYATAINSAGYIVGGCETQGMYSNQHAVLWDPNGTIHDLGDLPGGDDGSNANGINNSNQIVGNAYNGNGEQTGFLYHNGTMLDLNNLIDPNSGWNIDGAIAISNTGVILALADNSNVDPDGFGWGHTVLLTPLAGDANLDGKVDINDLTIVLANYDKTGATWYDGDFIGDGTVDINDLTIVLAHYGASYGAASRLAAVPEPSALVLSGVGVIGLLSYISRRKRTA